MRTEKYIGQQSSKFRPDIEGLRAIAVLSVVAYHYGVPAVSGGFVGVDIFFVISGYLITGLLVSEFDKTGKIDLVGFAGRRFKRLLPAALAMTIATLVAGLIVLSPRDQLPMVGAATASSVYISNFWFLSQAMNYFSPATASNPFLHTWSLSAEEQFYLVWPSLIWLVGSINRRWLMAALAAVAILSFSVCVLITFKNQPAAFYSSPLRAWEFAIGGLASMPLTKRWAQETKYIQLLGWIGLFGIGASFLTINHGMSFPGYITAVPAVSAAAVMIAGSGKNGGLPSALLSTKPFQFFGALSYSLYLWHWPAVAFLTYKHAVTGTNLMICFVISLLASMVSYVAIERPTRSSMSLSKHGAVALGVVLTSISVSVASASRDMAQANGSTPEQMTITRASEEQPLGSNNGCLIWLFDPIKRCVFGSSKYTRTVVVFGDSHADQWTTALNDIAERNGWRMITYLKSSCSASDVTPWNFRIMRKFTECDDWRRDVIARIHKDKPDLIFVTEASTGYLDSEITVDVWAKGLARTIRELGSKVVFLRDNLRPGFDVSGCLSRAKWERVDPSICTFRRTAVDTKLALAGRTAVERQPNATYVDLMDRICKSDICAVTDGDTIIYRDENHLTVDYTKHLEAALEAAIVPAVER